MKLTKYEHACFTVEQDGKLLVVDPGVWTTDLGSPENVIAIVVSHEHPDHFDVNALGALIAHNPEAKIYAHENITRQFGEDGETLPYESVDVGETVTIEPFTLDFFGGDHATIHPDMPIVPNLGIMINDKVFYPGDSFVNPEKAVDVLALPVAAPWMKISEALDYLLAVKPRLAFPTHDAVLSAVGKQLADNLAPTFAEKTGARYERLTEPLEI